MTTASPHEVLPLPSVVRGLERAARLGGVVTLAVGVLVLVGWTFDIAVLRNVHPSLPAMKANAALAFVLAGAALAVRQGWLSRVLSAVVSLIGVLTLVEVIPDIDLGIDELLFSDDADISAPGRMSPVTAITLVLIGGALGLIDVRFRKVHFPAEWFALAATAFSVVALLGSLYGVAYLEIGSYEAMAVHPAVTLVICSLAILCARPTRGVMFVVVSDGPGGALARRLLPAAFLVPAITGAILQAGDRAGWFDAEHATALFAATSIVCFTALTWWTASVLRRIDVARREAERAVQVSQAQLRQAQKMEAVGQLAGGIAHDFNNMLSVILGYGHLLTRHVPKTDPKSVYVDEMVLAGNRAAELTRQLLAFSRRQVLQPSPIDLEEVIANMSNMLRRVIGENVELEIITRAPDHVFVDPSQLEQVILNLVVNARDAMPEGGRITVTTSNVDLDAAFVAGHLGTQRGHQVVISVRDTGEGMDSATRAQIFEPFFTTKALGKGTGLGLATVLGIVEQSGGAIVVDSELGAGTTFSIYLPSHAPPFETPKAVPITPVVQHGTETILVVEDDEQVRKLTREVLRTHGYTVLEANNPGEAILICEQHRDEIHLMLTDVVMPRMSGRQLAERLAPLRPAMRIVFMSGYTDLKIDTTLAFLHKPIVPVVLLAKLREVLDT
ncbi:MAG: ATP-binding protein [Kofleriaceae bacterium]